MTARRLPIDRLPHWPRFLSREQAAAYVGVSPNIFDAEVTAGVWPPARPRGLRGGLLTWDRAALDRAADADLPSERSATDLEERRRAAAQRRQGRPEAAR